MTSHFKMATVEEKAYFGCKNAMSLQNLLWKDPPSDNAIRRWLKQFQETGRVLHRRGAGSLSISQEDVDRIQEALSRNPQQ
jgi:hypothetical protein